MKDLIFYINQVYFSLILFILIYRTTIFVKFSKHIPPIIGISLSPKFDKFFRVFMLSLVIFAILTVFARAPVLDCPLWIKGIIFFIAISVGILTKKESIQDVEFFGLRIYWTDIYSFHSIFSNVLFVLLAIGPYIILLIKIRNYLSY